MQTEVSGPNRTARIAALKGFGVGVLVVGLIAMMAMATLRETARPTTQQAGLGADVNHIDRPAVTAEEEVYARALWPIHSQVKQDAVKMTFAGLAYKMGDIKLGSVKERVAPLTPAFESALTALNKIKPPESVRALHREYSRAIALYRDASVEMVKVTVDGQDAHLLRAQEQSTLAANLTLKVGEALWPGEFKPN